MSDDLDAARAAIDEGQAKKAVRLAWNAAIAAVNGSDKAGIAAAIEVAETIRDASSGRTREEAEKIVAYAVYARDHPQPPRVLGVPLRQDGGRGPGAWFGR